jgi:hypothetical protein
MMIAALLSYVLGLPAMPQPYLSFQQMLLPTEDARLCKEGGFTIDESDQAPFDWTGWCLSGAPVWANPLEALRGFPIEVNQARR